MRTEDSGEVPAFRLILGTPQATRRTLARLCRRRFRGELDPETFDALTRAFYVLHLYDSAEGGAKTEDRFDMLEMLIAQVEQHVAKIRLHGEPDKAAVTSPGMTP